MHTPAACGFANPRPPAPAARSRAAISLFIAILTLLAPTLAHSAPENDAVPPEVEQAVDRGLDWLAHNQKPDGSFPQGGGSTTAVPSLAVMAFLARGHTPGQGKYGDVLNKAIDYVVSTQKENGILSASNNN